MVDFFFFFLLSFFPLEHIRTLEKTPMCKAEQRLKFKQLVGPDYLPIIQSYTGDVESL